MESVLIFISQFAVFSLILGLYLLRRRALRKEASSAELFPERPSFEGAPIELAAPWRQAVSIPQNLAPDLAGDGGSTWPPSEQ